MATFYFNIRYRHSLMIDVEGAVFASIDAAELEAMESIRDLVAGAILARTDDLPVAIEIVDAAGFRVTEVTLADSVPVSLLGPGVIHRPPSRS
jgi:hypothetical protein